MNKQRNESSDSNARGAWAESLAERWLVQQGLIVQSKNFHRRLGELDLVLRDATNNRWVFVEVKYRQHNALVTGVDSITAKKRQRLRRTANLFLQHHKDHTSEARIDVLVVVLHATGIFNKSLMAITYCGYRTPLTEKTNQNPLRRDGR